METHSIVLIVWLVGMDLAAFAAMGIDKHRARRGGWRVRERDLFLLAILGGSVGAIVGMWLFRHKTRHWYFVVGMPAILLAQLAAAYLLIRL